MGLLRFYYMLEICQIKSLPNNLIAPIISHPVTLPINTKDYSADRDYVLRRIQYEVFYFPKTKTLTLLEKDYSLVQ